MNKKINLEQRSSCGVSSSVGTYRADIDGLRALAVFAVVFFHIDPALLAGGFVGVDVFFVISGFLITGNIVFAKEQGRFSYKEFYRRRIKRILPVLFFVILSTLIVAQLIFLPSDFARLADSALAAQLSLANVYFTYFLDTSYFANDAAFEPLLHLWSLGVEEQFYLIWPLVLLSVSSSRTGRLLLAILFLIIVSMILGEFLAPSSPMFAYYMLPTRAFQLLAGAFCFLIYHHNLFPRLSLYTNQLLSLLGVALVLGSMILLDDSMRYPGINALPVTLGAGILMLTGTSTNIVARLLSLKPVVLIGLISYSLYLWHWPVLAFARYILVELSVAHKMMLFAIMLCLSVASYRFVEQPFRSTSKKFGVVLLNQFIIPTVVIVVLAIGVKLTDGFGLYHWNESYKEKIQLSDAEPEPASRAPYVCQARLVNQNMLRDRNCAINTKVEPPTLLWGDSNAAHYVGIIKAYAEKHNFGFRNVAHSGCPPIFASPERFIADSTVEDCVKSLDLLKSRLDDYSVIIMGASWWVYAEKDLSFIKHVSDTVSELQKQGKKVILLGKVPVLEALDNECVKKKIKLSFLPCGSNAVASRVEVDAQNRWIKDLAAKLDAGYFELTDLLCDEDRCLSTLNGYPLYLNRSHLSRIGAEIVGKELLSSEVLSTPFQSINAVPFKAASEAWVSSNSIDEAVLTDVSILSGVEDWNGKRKIEVHKHGLRFIDDSTTNVVAWSANFVGSENNSKFLEVGDALLVDLVIGDSSASNALFRIELVDQQKTTYDFIVNPKQRNIFTKQAGRYAKWSMKAKNGRLLVRILLPESSTRQKVEIFLYPAAADNKGAYGLTETGVVDVESIQIGVRQN